MPELTNLSSAANHYARMFRALQRKIQEHNRFTRQYGMGSTMTQLKTAPAAPGKAALHTCWILSDGKAGDETPCLGVAEALGLTPQVRRVAPRAPWLWTMPWGPIDPREREDRPQSPLRPPYPELAIASGRRAVAYLRRIKRLSGGRTFTVFLKDPRTGTGAADFIWVPQHDALRGKNVLATLTSPHRISAERLAAARQNPPAPIAVLPRPRVAVLIGGDSGRLKFSSRDVARFTQGLETVAAAGTALMGTLSRRTALTRAALAEGVSQVFAGHGGYLWEGTGDNPYAALLANADAIIVTADSVNMVGEALAAGVPVHVFYPHATGRARKIAAFLRTLAACGAIRPFPPATDAGRLETAPCPPIDSTPVIAAAIAAHYDRFRATRDAGAGAPEG